MPHWIHGTDKRKAPPSERRFASALRSLPATFSILWRYYYTDSSRGNKVREGDFIIHGPGGHLLVVECKTSGFSFQKQVFWEGQTPVDDPVEQLYAQKNWLLGTMRERFPDHPPYVDATIFLPQILAPQTDVDAIHGIPRPLLLGLTDLQNFSSWWNMRFAGKKSPGGSNILASLAPQTGLKSNARTSNWVKEELGRLSGAKFQLLDALRANQQLFVQGGPGTGKTWLAVETARRWARKGHRVLFLCFNLELESRLRAMVGGHGIRVHSFESLARSLLGRFDLPSGEEQIRHFWWETLPEKLLGHVTSHRFKAPFDALVVDEAQDHDTAFSPSLHFGADNAGWWTIYFYLLQGGSSAPIAVFFDSHQRMVGRLGEFNPLTLLKALLNPVQLHLDQVVRYTRPIREFLQTLVSPSTRNLAASMRFSSALPEGPRVQVIPVNSPAMERSSAQKLVHDWTRDEHLRPEDFLILFRSVSKIPGWARSEKLGPFTLHQGRNQVGGKIHVTSIKKARGLESKAVILTGLPSWSKIKSDDELAHLYFTGASRAQQYLAVLEKTF